jgi:hypothetical protein
MKKDGKLYTIMLRNQYINTAFSSESQSNYFDKQQLDNISTSANIINEYKKFKKSNCFNSDIKLSKTTSIYTKNTSNKEKVPVPTSIFPTKKYFKKKVNYNFYIHNKSRAKSNQLSNISNNNIIEEKSENKNIIFSDDTDHNSSMETIKNILYNTECIKDERSEEKNKKEEKVENNIPDLIQSDKLNENEDDNDMLDEKILFPKIFKKINNRKSCKENSRIFKNIDDEFVNKENNIENIEGKENRKNLVNKINKNLTFQTKYATLNSMKKIKNENNYDYDYDIFDNKYNTINDEFRNMLDEKEANYNGKVFKNKNIINGKNNNYSVKKINNNINININNNNNNKIDNQINNINYTSRYQNMGTEHLFDLKERNNFDYEEYFSMKQKIKELTEEINNKNILINEYSTLAKESKSKFEQLIEHNKKKISELKEEAKKQNNQLNTKINNLEKEKQDLLNKDKENQKYISFLEMLLFDDNKNNNINDKKDENNDKNFEEILQIKVSDIKKLQKELENKNEEIEKLKKIIVKLKNNQIFRADRAISNPRKNIIEIENKIKKELKSDNNNKNDNNKKKMHISLNQNIGCKNLLNGLNLNDHSKNE